MAKAVSRSAGMTPTRQDVFCLVFHRENIETGPQTRAVGEFRYPWLRRRARPLSHPASGGRCGTLNKTRDGLTECGGTEQSVTRRVCRTARAAARLDRAV